MLVRRLLLPSLVIVVAAGSVADVPRGWRWTTRQPFRDVMVAASSEQADRWPAEKAVDGDTSEPEGIWQTLRNSPKSAWLELRLAQPRRVKGVRIFHQRNPRYYRSVDYSLAAWVAGAWKTVAEVQGNKQAGWRAHTFDPVETTKIRITITKSEHGYRMGLNEVELVLVPQPGRDEDPRVRLSPPHRCGKVAEMGAVMFDVDQPKGTRVELCTRTAPDAGGKPGAWSDWSKPYARSGAPIASPPGEWVQYRSTFHRSAAGAAKVREVALGSPSCVEHVDLNAIVPEAGKPMHVAVRFSRAMDRSRPLVGELALPGQPPQTLQKGTWDDTGRTFRFTPLTPGPKEGLGHLVVGGARTADGVGMMHESVPIAVGTQALLKRLRSIAAWMIKNPQRAIFVEGYNQRTLLGLYEITGEKRYLDHVRKWAHKLLDAQDPAGFWGTGYRTVYFADTGSALGLFINFYKFASPAERKRIDTALGRYFHLLLVRGDSTGKPFVHDGGSLGVGFTAYRDGKAQGDLNKPYTISTALTGAEIFAAMYYLTGKAEYKQIAVKACDWILATMAPSGQIPYYIDDWNPGRKDKYWVWQRWPYDTSAYVGEGFLAAWTYIDDPAFRQKLARRVRPHIEWLLRTQNEDGSWAKKGSGDQLRSHGVVNLLLWYYEKVQPDPRVAAAIRRWYLLLLDEKRSAYLRVPGNGIATSLAGRALVEIVKPGVDCCRWKDQPKARPGD